VSTPRFFLDVDLAAGQCVALPAPVAHHARRVLRLRDGAAIVLFNGRGGEYSARLEAGAAATAAAIEQFRAIERESPLRLTLIQALLATEKLDWITGKAVELGVARLHLAPCERSVVQLRGDRLRRRVTHLREVAIASCGQCGRNRIPAIDLFADFGAALRASGTGAILVPDREAAALTALTGGTLALAVGPEGGFTPAEVAAAVALGFQPVRLGPRVLRTETAGLAAVAVLQALRGDFGADALGSSSAPKE
jgi:16S rRNA (uracil1498-N3)-methyltransferase